MSISLYKPNSKNSGCAFKFSIGTNKSKEPTIYINAIQQHSWDSTKKIGSFSGNASDPEKKISLKFNESEVGAIIHAFETRTEYSTFHSFDDNKTSIKCIPWDKETKSQGKTTIVPAFGINITRNGNQTFRIPIEPGEIKSIISFFNYFFSKLHDFRFKKEQEIIAKSQQNKTEETSQETNQESPVPF